MASRLSSPRFQRKLMWGSGGFLIVAAVVFGVTFLWTGPKPKPIPTWTGKVQIPTHDQNVPLETAAKQVGERFIETAVVRHRLAASFTLVAPEFRQGLTLHQWESGNIPVVPYPADITSPAPVKIEWSYKNKAMLLILLLPRDGIVTTEVLRGLEHSARHGVCLAARGLPAAQQSVVDLHTRACTAPAHVERVERDVAH